MDITVVISRNAAWVVAALCVCGGFIGLPLLINILTTVHCPFWFTATLCGYLLVSISVFPKLRLWIQTEAKIKFLKGTYDYRGVLTSLVNQFSRATSASHIHTILSDNIATYIEVASIDLLIPENFDGNSINTGSYASPSGPSAIRLAASNPIVPRLIQNNAPIFALDSNDPIFDAFPTIKGLCPCMYNDKLLGIVMIGAKLSHDTYTPDDLDLFRLLGSQIAIALTRLQQIRFEAELTIAQRIQSEILPHSPTIPNITVSCKMIPASEMGGDYYDVIPTPTGTWIMLGDVTGHGIGSAMVMFMIQSIIMTLITSQAAHSPSDLLFRANTILWKNMDRLEEPRPLTILAMFTTDGRHFELCGAHDSIFRIRGNGIDKEIETIEVDQFPIGIGLIPDLKANEFKSASFVLETGDILYLGTDGVTEAANGGIIQNGQFGTDSLSQFLTKHASLPPHDIAEKLEKTLRRYSNDVVHDDITYLILKAT